MKTWWGKFRHWSKYQCEMLVDLCTGVGSVWLTTTRTRESVMPLLSLSPLNVLTHLQKVVCFIHFHLFTTGNNAISDGKSYSCNDTFTDVWFTSLLVEKNGVKIVLCLATRKLIHCFVPWSISPENFMKISKTEQSCWHTDRQMGLHDCRGGI